jgi:nucleobase:cation symporter-1, NCS1 family
VSFRAGGLLAAALGVLLCPWLVLDMYIGWLVSYSGLLGAVSGVLLADYWLLRRTRLDLDGLYRDDGPYAYAGGVNRRAIAATVAGALVVLSGKLIPGAAFLFEGAWFSGVLTSGAVYLLLMRGR